MAGLTTFRLPNINAEWSAVETTFSDTLAVAEAEPIAVADPSRYALIFSLNEGGSGDRITTKPDISVLQGISLVVGVPVMITVKDFGPLPFFAWFFNNNTTPWNITVYEVRQIN